MQNCAPPRLGPPDGRQVDGTDGMSVTAYVRRAGTVAAVVNVVLNPLLAWLTHRARGFVPLAGSSGVIVDVALTSVLLSLLVALFTVPAAKRDLGNQRVRMTEGCPRAGHLLSKLPARAWSLGLLLGVGVACVVTLVFWLFGVLGLSGLPFTEFVAFKAVYTGLLAFVVTRWVILRELTEALRRLESVTS
jgi:hypothetical protein